ncbi:MAG: tyrosine-type recombinase/integrase [Longicatena sp.]
MKGDVFIMPAYKDEKTKKWTSSFRFTDNKGNKLSKKKRGFNSAREADKWELEYKLSYNGDVNMTFESFVEVYFNDKANSIKSSTERNKKKIMSLHILPFFKKYKISDIKPIDIIRWQNKMKSLNLAPTYLRTLHNQITAILNHAVKYYGLTSNPVHIVGSMGEKYSENKSFYTYDEFLKFRSCIQDEMYLCIMDLLFFGGFRRGELLALTKKDFDFSNNTVSVNKALNDIGEITSPKTKKSVRTISVPKKVMEEVKSYISKIYGIKDHHIVFDIHRGSIGRYIDKYASEAGLKRITVHQFRHSHITHLHQLGFTFQEIADRVGHDDTNTTIRIYTHCCPARQTKIAETLDALIL